MSAATLLAELDAAGVHIGREGDALRVRGEPGVTLDVYTPRIKDGKRAILAVIALQDQIVAAATADPSQFDRARYDALWRRWDALATDQESDR